MASRFPPRGVPQHVTACVVCLFSLATGCGTSSEPAQEEPTPPSETLDQPRVPVVADTDLNVVVSSDPDSPFSHADFREGLEAFRRPHAKGACASCHTPDAFDLAFFDYSDGTILRRAFGVEASVEDAHAIVRLVHFQRERLGLRPVDPTRYSPLQPGGEVLPGEDVFDTERAFVPQLSELDHPYLTGRIDSPEAAHAALEWIAGLDLRTIRVGFPFPRWTDDEIRGDGHHSINDWIPEFPSHPKEGSEIEWYALHNAYIEEPNPENLWAIYDRRVELTDNLNLYPYVSDSGGPSSIARTFGTDMYGAVLVGGHMLRTGSFSRPDSGYLAIETHDSPHATNDPFVKDWRDLVKSRVERFWEVAASFGSGGHPFPSWDEWPSFILDKDAGYFAEDHGEVRRRVARSWFWMGYMFDPHLKFTAARNRAEYFPQHLDDDGFLIHSAFAQATMAATLIYGRDNRWARQNWVYDNGDAAGAFGAGMSGFGWLHRETHLEPRVGHSYESYPEDLAEVVRVFQVNDLRARIFAALGSLRAGYGTSQREVRLETFDEYRELLESNEDPELWPTLESVITETRAALQAAVEVGEFALNATEFDDRSHVGRTEGERGHIPLGIPESAYSSETASPITETFERLCSGCHGASGEGRGPGGELAGHRGQQTGYPSLSGYSDFEGFSRFVRMGSNRTRIVMPWFTTAQVNDDELRAMFEALRDR